MMGGWNTGGYGFEVYFSTYDGNTNAYPWGFPSSLSYELMPSSPGESTYYTDFVIFAPAYNAYYKRGAMTVTIPKTDADGNGCPDALQVNKSFSNTGSVSSTEYNSDDGGYTWYFYGFRTYSFTFSRSEGNSFGSLTGSGFDPATGTSSTFSGSYNVEGGAGGTTYNPTTRAITFAGNSFSFGTSGAGTSTFTRINDNEVSVAQFNFTTTDAYSRTVKAFTLKRTNNYYRAYPVELSDGDPSTSYVDFRYCHVEILDSNDTDGDGIPDLSDANSKINQTITFGALISKTYGDNSFTLTGSASSGLAVSYSSSNTSVATVSGSVVTIVGAGSTTITASQAGNSSYNAATIVSQALTVNKASQTISFITLPAKTYGDSSFTLTGSSTSGLSVSYSSSNPSVATVSGNTVAIVAAGTSTITAIQDGNSNYDAASSVSQTLSVSRATLGSSLITLTAPSSLVYNGSLKSYTASASGVSGFSYTYAGVSPTVYASSATAPKDVGTYTVTASSTDANYSGNKTANFTITPKLVTITASDKTKVYGSADPTFTYTSSGLIGSDSISGALTRAAGENVGSYNILVGTLSAGANYMLSYTGASLGITAASLSSSAINITAPSSLVYDGTGKGHTASASGVSGFSYTYAGVSPTVYASSATAPKDVGTYTVTASSTDANYSGNKTANFTITPKLVTITASDKTKVYGSADPTFTYTSSGLIGSDSISGALTRAAGENVGSYDILLGTLSAGPNYYFSAADVLGGKLAITHKSLSISGITILPKRYDGNRAATVSGGELVGVVLGDNVILSGAPTGLFDSPNPGSGIGVVVAGYELSGSSAGNYTLLQPAGLSGSITTTIQSWASAYGLTGQAALAEYDPDNDGKNNAAEYAFGGNPATPDQQLVSASPVLGGIKFVWLQRKDQEQVTYSPKTSTDLALSYGSWVTVNSAESNPQPVDISADYKQMEVVLPTSARQGFLKIEANIQ